MLAFDDFSVEGDVEKVSSKNLEKFLEHKVVGMVPEEEEKDLDDDEKTNIESSEEKEIDDDFDKMDDDFRKMDEESMQYQAKIKDWVAEKPILREEIIRFLSKDCRKLMDKEEGRKIVSGWIKTNETELKSAPFYQEVEMIKKKLKEYK